MPNVQAQLPHAAKIYFIIFLEGFISISLEVQLIRQLLPFVGGSIIITSLIIGIFLLFLAAGYYQGSLITENFEKRLRFNLSCALVLLGIGMSTLLMHAYFVYFLMNVHANPILILSIYLVLVIAPLVYFLGQTLPLTMNLLPKTHFSGKIGGHVLAISTTGSFLGATLTTTLIMNYFGVAWNIMGNCLLLASLTLILCQTNILRLKKFFFVITMLFISYTCTVHFEKKLFDVSNSYADYRITTNPHTNTKQFSVNLSDSSILHANKKGYPYIETMKRILFNDLTLRNKNILVLGAGGFTLSAEKTLGNHFTYVDIDKQLSNIVVPKFSKKINGHFVGKDARTFLIHNQEKFHAIVIDVYSGRMQIPPYLLTREFFSAIKTHLTKNGVALFNVIANPSLSDAFSKRVDNTLHHVFGNCMAIPEQYSDHLTNIIYACQPGKTASDPHIYTDNLNSSSIDYFKSIK